MNRLGAGVVIAVVWFLAGFGLGQSYHKEQVTVAKPQVVTCEVYLYSKPTETYYFTGKGKAT